MRGIYTLALAGMCLLSLTACTTYIEGITGSTPPSMPGTLQAANTVATYPVASATVDGSGSGSAYTVTKSGIRAAGDGDTVTITTGADGSILSLAVSISAGGVAFYHTYSPGPELPAGPIPVTLASLRDAFNMALQLAPGIDLHSITTVFVMQNSDLSYSFYGPWISNNGTDVAMGAIAGGAETPLDFMPTTGTASYAGYTAGAGYTPAGPFVLTGTASITANFGTGNVETTFSDLQTRNIASYAAGTLPTLTGSGSIAASHYQTIITGGSLAGTAVGAFYGPRAVETAGTWQVSGGGITAIGAFGARQ